MSSSGLFTSVKSRFSRAKQKSGGGDPRSTPSTSSLAPVTPSPDASDPALCAPDPVDVPANDPPLSSPLNPLTAASYDHPTTPNLLYQDLAKDQKSLKFLSTDKKTDGLKILNYAYILSDSPLLLEIVEIAWNIVQIVEKSDAKLGVLRMLAESLPAFTMAILDLVKDGEDKETMTSSLEFSHFIRILRDTSKMLPNLAQKSANERESVINEFAAKLRVVMAAMKNKHPSLSSSLEPQTKPHLIESSGSSSKIVSSALEVSIGTLKIAKEACQIVPVPFLQGAVSTALILLQTAKETRTNRSDMQRIADMAGDFVTAIYDTCVEPGYVLPSHFQSAVKAFTESLEKITDKCQKFSQKSLFKRLVTRESDKEGITECKEELQHAIRIFNTKATILYQDSLGIIVDRQNRQLLELLPHAPISYPDSEYLASSRTEELQKIAEWIETPAPGNQVFWLRGAAGMGKSTIASHLRDVLGKSGRLAAHFFFDHNNKKQEDPGYIIGTLAYQLAHISSDIKAAVCDSIQYPPSDQLFLSQFKARVLSPLLACHFSLPMVIILDTLDEYKDVLDLLKVLADVIGQFPSTIRIFVTSRPQRQLEALMSELKALVLDLGPASSDIMCTFFNEHLQSIQGWRKQPPTAVQISQLVRLADGLFVWAATACSVIAEPNIGCPDDILEQLLFPQSKFRRSAESSLHSLYSGALLRIYPDKPGSSLSLENFQRVLGSIVVISRPLTISAIQVVLGNATPVNAIMSDLRGLQSRVSTVLTGDALVTPSSALFHSSFLDFITGFDQGNRFHLEKRKCNAIVAIACLQLMAQLFESDDKHTEYTQLSDAHQFAVDSWFIHACGSDTVGLSNDVRKAIVEFCSRYFESWFRVQLQSVKVPTLSGPSQNLTPDAPDCLNSLAVSFEGHKVHMTDIPNLDKVISVQQVVVRFAGDNHPGQAGYLILLGDLYARRFSYLGIMRDLEVTLEYYNTALKLCPTHNPTRSIALTKVAETIRKQFCQIGGNDKLNRSILMLREASELPASNKDKCKTLNALGEALRTRFQYGIGDSQDLTDAISLFRQALKLKRDSEDNRTESFKGLAAALVYRFRQTRMVDDLDDAISMLQKVLDLHPPPHPDRPVSLHNLSAALGDRFRRTGLLQDLDKSIALLRESLQMRPDRHPERSWSLTNLATCLVDRYNMTGEVDHLNEAILLNREALALRPGDHPRRSESVHGLAKCLHIQFGKTGDIHHLDEAILMFREALMLRPGDHPSRSELLHVLGICLQNLFKRTDEVHHLHEALLLLREALAQAVQRDPSRRSEILHDLGSCILSQYQKTGEVHHLQEAIPLLREALALRPAGDHLSRTKSHLMLGICLSSLFAKTGEVHHLHEAISSLREALVLQSGDQPSRSEILHELGISLCRLFEKTGKLQHLHEAILLAREASALRPGDHPSRSESLHELGVYLSSLFKKTGDIHHLHEAILLLRETLVLQPRGHRSGSESIHTLGLFIYRLFEKTGEVHHLHEAVLLLRESLVLRPKDHPRRSISLINLGPWLYFLFQKTDEVQHLHEAILVFREALVLQPGNSFIILQLAYWLFSLFSKTSNLADLDEAIKLLHEGLAVGPRGDTNRFDLLRLLAHCLLCRFKWTKKLPDLEEAVQLNREALVLRPLGHPNRSQALRNLAVCLNEHFIETRELYRLDEAILLCREVLALQPRDQPNRWESLTDLAHFLRDRFHITGEAHNAVESIKLYREVLTIRPDDPELPKRINDLTVALSARNIEPGEPDDFEEVNNETTIQLPSSSLADLD